MPLVNSQRSGSTGGRCNLGGAAGAGGRLRMVIGMSAVVPVGWVVEAGDVFRKRAGRAREAASASHQMT